MCAPPRSLLRRLRTCEPAALPRRVVRVADRQGRQRRGLAGGEGRVEAGELAEEEVERPAIPGEVLRQHEEHVLPLVQPGQEGAQERRAAGVLRDGRLGVEPGGERGLAASGRLFGEVEEGDLQRQRRLDLAEEAGSLAPEGRPQRLVACDDLLQAPLERAAVERARQAPGGRQVVHQPLRGVHLLEQEQPLLQQRRPRGLSRRPLERGLRRGSALGAVHQGRKPGDGRRLEEAAERELDAVVAPEPGEDLGRQERVAAEREEVVVDADPRQGQGLPPERGQELLGGRAGRHEIGGRSRVATLRRRERAPVDLAARRERQPGQPDQRRRDHVVGERPPQRRLHGGVVRERGCLSREVPHQPLVPRPVLAEQHRRGLDAGAAHQRVLDLAELDAEAAQLHLVVVAAEALELAVLQPAPEVAGAVEQGAGLAGERVGDEPLGGEVGPPQVTEADAPAADPQLPGHADRHRLAPGVEHVDLRVGDRLADEHPADDLRHAVHRRPDGGLGRTVAVPHLGAAPDQLLGEVLGHRLARADGAQPLSALPAGGEQQAPGGGRGVDEGDLLLVQHAQEEGSVGGHLTADQRDGGPDRQREQHLGDRDVEGERGDGEGHVAPPQARGDLHRGEQVGQRPVWNQHALGLARRARGVEHVGGVLGACVEGAGLEAGLRLCAEGGVVHQHLQRHLQV